MSCRRKIYLIRHGSTGGLVREKTYCIGSTDLPLGPLGRMQACLLRAELESRTDLVFCSTLLRARETAAFLSASPAAVRGLEEMDQGLWDGLSFDEIRAKWPELYAARGADKGLLPPGAEPPADVLQRAREAFLGILGSTSGNIAIVTHACVIDLLMGEIAENTESELFRFRIPCGAYFVLEYDPETGVLESDGVPRLPHPGLDRDLCLDLLDAAGTPPEVIRHCEAVARKADSICTALGDAGPDRKLLQAAALLHDIARVCPDHPSAGAQALCTLGYPEIADVIAVHHDLPETELHSVNARTVLYYADKRLSGDREVTLKERFDASLEKCRTPEALRKHALRKGQAETVEETLHEAAEKDNEVII